MTNTIKRGQRSLDAQTVHRLRTETFKISECAKGILSGLELESLGIEDVALNEPISKLTSFATWIKPTEDDSWSQIKGVGAETFAREVMMVSHRYLKDWNGETDQSYSKLRSDVMILGVNAGSGGTNIDWEDFMIFHDNITGGHRPSTVYKYLPYIMDTRLAGAYMTDAFKGLPTSDASSLKTHLTGVAEQLGYGTTSRSPKVRDFISRVYALFARVLDVEMSILGVPKMFIIMGTPKSIIHKVLEKSELVRQTEEGYVAKGYIPHSGNAVSDETIKTQIFDVDGYMRTVGVYK